MNPTIFYSWQSDSPKKSNWTFIRTCIEEAVKELAIGDEVVDSPRVDAGMEGISGTPEVATIMFEKIAASHIFIGDVTLVGSIPPIEVPNSRIISRLQSSILNKYNLQITKTSKTKKLVPNSNVVLEMGYAAGVLGWGRIICVMNEYFGLREQQPFDVRNRRFPINYTLNPDDRTTKQSVKQRLVSDFKHAVNVVLQNELNRALRVSAYLT